MGIDIQLYRRRIAAFTNTHGMSKMSHGSVNMSDRQSFCIRPCVVLILTLIVMAGLETNPGPRVKDITLPPSESSHEQQVGGISPQHCAFEHLLTHDEFLMADLLAPLYEGDLSEVATCTVISPIKFERLDFDNPMLHTCCFCLHQSPRDHVVVYRKTNYLLGTETQKTIDQKRVSSFACKLCHELHKAKKKQYSQVEQSYTKSDKHLLECCLCGQSCSRRYMIIFRKSLYPRDIHVLKGSGNLVCKTCRTKYKQQVNNSACLVCCQLYQRQQVVIFLLKNYKWTNDTVLTAFGGVPRVCQSDSFVCKNCHLFLRKCLTIGLGDGDDIFLAHILEQREYAQRVQPDCMRTTGVCNCDKCVVHKRQLEEAELAFETQIRESMDYICIVCERALFKHSVHAYCASKYDHTNPTVFDAFSTDRIVSQGKQYICNTCHECLRTVRKRTSFPRLPSQAVANQLRVEQCPSELSDLNDLEVRFVAQKIPFMKLVSLPKGGQKGLQGPCVNVPSQMNRICHVFPRFAEDITVVDFALKRKISYKTSYMQMLVHPASVMSALCWLHEHNSLYQNIIINGDWLRYSEENCYMRMLTGNTTGIDVIRSECDGERNQLDKDFQEDQIAADHMAEISVLPSDSVIHREDVEGYCFAVAPGEGNKPQSVLRDVDIEVLAFPHLFPTGRFAYDVTVPRKVNLTMRRYFDRQLLHYSGKFARNREWMFTMQYRVTEQQVHNMKGIAMCLKKGSKFRGQTINAGLLRDPQAFSSMAYEGLVYNYLRQVRGTPAYWKLQMLDCLAMVRSCGVPTFFLTLSAAEYHWPDMIVSLARFSGRIIAESDVINLSWEEKTTFLNNNPVLTVKLFEQRVQALFDKYLKSPAQPLGYIRDYVIKIEFQARGSPHAHCLLWIQDAPTLKDHSLDVVARFVHQHVSCESSEQDDMLNELVKTRQTHRHSAYCRKSGKCRFGFPKCMSSHTLVTEIMTSSVADIARMKLSVDMLERFSEFCKEHDTMNLEELLVAAGMSSKQYHEALAKSRNGHKIILKRDRCDVHTNNFNCGILKLWKANMDLQYITDPISAVMYVCSYMMKSDAAMGELLKAVTRECVNSDVYTQLTKIGNAFLQGREVSQQEAIMLGTGMRLMRKSRVVKFVSANIADERTKIPRRDCALLDEDDEDVFQSSIHDWYSARQGLSELCLADFATIYDVSGNESGDEHDDNLVEEIDDARVENSELPATVVVNMGQKVRVFHKRRRPAILRSHIPKLDKDSEGYFHAHLLLFCAYRSESDFLSDSETPYMDYYMAHRTQVLAKADSYNFGDKDFENAWRIVNSGHLPHSAWDELAPGAEEQNAAARYEGLTIDRNHEVEEGDIEVDNVPRGLSRDVLSKRYDIEANKQVINTATYKKRYMMLNVKQREAVQYNRAHLKEYIQCHMNGTRLPDGFKLFLSGPGGTGKSFVLQMIQRDTHYFMNHKLRKNRQNPLLLMTAYTGTAAFVIDGITLHSALGLGGFSDHLSDKKRAILKSRLEDLVTLVIDECSMVSPKCLIDVHNRLCIARGSDVTQQSFGNYNVMCVGDLYQLSPVKGKRIFEMPANTGGTSHLSSLWREHFEYIELTEPMRQRDKQFSDLLLAIRRGPPVPHGYHDKLLQHCQIEVDDTHQAYPHDSIHVYAQNEHCHTRNIRRLEQLQGNVVTLVCKDNTKDVNTRVGDIIFPTNPMKTGRLMDVLQLKIGAQVMLTDNLDVSDGLTNGAKGVVTGFIAEQNPVLHQRVVQCVMVKFHAEKVGATAISHSVHKAAYPTSVPIKRICKEFEIVPSHLHSSVVMRRMNTIKVQRTQFPLFLAWAVTVHKVQGMTLDSIVVDMSLSKGRYQSGMAYVAFSRVRALNDLHIVNYNRDQIKSDAVVNIEIDRLRTMCQYTREDQMFSERNQLGLKVILLNVCGLNENKSFFSSIHDMSLCDICCLTETHVTRNSTVHVETFPCAQFECFRKDRNKNGGGVAIFIANRLHPIEISFVTCLELVVVLVSDPSNVVVMCVYRPPSLGIRAFATEIERILHLLFDAYPGISVCCMGDMNINLWKNPDNDLSKCMKAFGFAQIVEQSTHDSGSLIDHVYSTHPNRIECCVTDCMFSDHDAIVMFISDDNSL